MLDPQPEGGYTVTSPALPELITEGDTAEEALHNLHDALRAVVELYEDMGRPLPPEATVNEPTASIQFEARVTAS